MKIFIALFLSIALFGCGDTYVTPQQMESAEVICADNDGLVQLKILEENIDGKTLRFRLICDNGAIFYMDTLGKIIK